MTHHVSGRLHNVYERPLHHVYSLQHHVLIATHNVSSLESLYTISMRDPTETSLYPRESLNNVYSLQRVYILQSRLQDTPRPGV